MKAHFEITVESGFGCLQIYVVRMVEYAGGYPVPQYSQFTMASDRLCEAKKWAAQHGTYETIWHV